jgi:hypothetical protein
MFVCHASFYMHNNLKELLNIFSGSIWGSQISGYEELYLLIYNAM